MDYSKAIAELLSELVQRGINLHSVLITRDGETLYERYVPPFSGDKPQRMYSQTKSLVSMAIGCLIDEGKLRLEDRITQFFPDKLPAALSGEMRAQTVRDMLMMNTCLDSVYWFRPEVSDRTAYYFAQTPLRPAGTLFSYDSTGSYVLGVLVERVSGMPLMEYMRKKFLDAIGGFENAYILACMDGTPWADSGLMCTTRAMERFGRLLMQEGAWQGKQLISREYVRAATSRQTDNALSGGEDYDSQGYGYQIWLLKKGFALIGMGGQLTIALPKERVIFACTGDNQYAQAYGSVLFNAVTARLSPDAPVEAELSELKRARGAAHSEFEREIEGALFVCAPNPMGIEYFSLSFGAEEGELRYKNAQGEKQLRFGLGKNLSGLFPELGYSDGYGNRHEINGFMYRDEVSAGWVEPRKLQIFVQITDRYLGTCVMNFGFRDKNTCGIRMIKSAEDFLDTYQGWASARREE